MANIADCVIAVAPTTTPADLDEVRKIVEKHAVECDGEWHEYKVNGKVMFKFLNFGAKWCFREEIVDEISGRLFQLDWQGACAEIGNETYCADLGNTDFGIYIKQRYYEDDDEGLLTEGYIEFPELD